MREVTRILTAIEHGDARAADELLPLVYQEFRQLAAQWMKQEKPGQTLQATALVHEAYIRLVGSESQNWDGRTHFFAAAAEPLTGASTPTAASWSIALRAKRPVLSSLFGSAFSAGYDPDDFAAGRVRATLSSSMSGRNKCPGLLSRFGADLKKKRGGCKNRHA